MITNENLRKDLGRNIKAGNWLVVYMLFLPAASYAGSSRLGGRDLIRYPLDLLVVVSGAVGFFFWGCASAFLTPEIEATILSRGKPAKSLPPPKKAVQTASDP